MFAELRKLHGSGAIRGYYNVWACLHALRLNQGTAQT